MNNHVLQNMISRTNIDIVHQSNFLDFLRNTEYAVLFFAENPDRYPETADVACVLPELLKAFPVLTAALVGEADQHALQQQFNFTKWPTLAFFVNAQYRGEISGIQNWDDYQSRINELLYGNAKQTIPAINV